MQVTCKYCNAKYKIADEKLVGRKRIRLRCKKCENIIEVPIKNFEEDSNSLFSTSPKDAVSNVVKPKAKDDVFEENLFSASLQAKEFAFEDAKSTLVLNRDENTSDNLGKESNQPKFKSSFQLDFSDSTSQYDAYKEQQQQGFKPRNSAAVSFETTQQISVEKFNEYQKQHNNPTLAGASEGSSEVIRIDNNTKKKFDSISDDFTIDDSGKGGGVLKFMFFLFFLISVFFVFVLYKNNWNFNVDNIPKMIEIAFSGKIKIPDNNRIVKKEKPLSEQFFIEPKKIKTKLFKFSKRRKDKRYIFVVSGEIKNIDSKKKSLTTVRVLVNRISDKTTILDKRVYAGNVFTKKDIIKAKNEENLDAEYLQSGQNGINWGVLPGKTVPFMVVFWLDKKLNMKDIKIKIEIASTQ